MRMKSLATWFVVATIVATAPALTAQSTAPRTAATSKAGLSTERLARIDRLLQHYVDENRIAGAVALVLRDGQPVYEHAVGWGDKEAGRRMTTDTIFRIASQTKAHDQRRHPAARRGRQARARPIRSAASFRRSRRPRSRVRTKRASTIVPAQAADHDPRPADAHRRHLVRHGAARRGAVRSQGARARGRRRLVHRRQGRSRLRRRWSGSATLPFVAQPGEAWVYGYNTDMLGCVVEHASGMPLDAVHQDAHHRPARHEGHAVLPAAGAARPARRGVRERRRRDDHARARRRARPGRIRRRPAEELRRRRRPALDRARLRALPRDDAQRRRRSTACASSRRARSS